MKRQSLLALVTLFFLARSAAGQVPVPACTMSYGGIADDFGVATFERVADGAMIVVEARVQSSNRGVQPPSGGPYQNEVLLTPIRVLKGPAMPGPFVVGQFRADGFFEMQPGQRFILFLSRLSTTNPAAFPGNPRYDTTQAALLCIDSGKVLVSPEGDYLRARFDGVELERAIADIQAYVRIRRVSGRIVVDNGVFPPSGTPYDIFLNPIDNPGNLKVVLTPVAPAGALPGTVPRPSVALHANPNFVIGPNPPRPMWLSSLPQIVETRESLDSGPRITFVDRGGAFILPVDPGSYRVTVDGLPLGYYVKSISYGSRDLSTELLSIDGASEPAASELTVTLTDKAPSTEPAGAKVSGRVTGIPATVLPLNLWITLMSDSGGSIRSSSAQFTSDGVFEFRNVPPGRYTLRTMEQLLAPAGAAWGGPSIVSIIVAEQDRSIEVPFFAGVEVTAQVVDKNMNPTAIRGPFLTITAVGGPAESTITLLGPQDGLYRFWLSRGEYTIRGRDIGGGPSVTGITDGSVDLLKANLKIEGASPVNPIRIIVE